MLFSYLLPPILICLFLVIAFFLKIPKIVIFVIVVSSLLLLATTFRSGLLSIWGLPFWGPHGHDGIWHIAVINQIRHSLPPQNPVFSGTILNNYHWGFDLVAALFTLLMPVFDVYFRFLPLALALSLGLFSFLFCRQLKLGIKPSVLFIILNFFAGSLGFIVTLIRSGQLGGESLFWSMQSASTLINPPYALSLVLLLAFLTLWHQHQPRNKAVTAILLGILFSFLTIIKIYAAILLGLSLAIYYLFSKSKFNLLLPLSMALSSLLIIYFLGLLSGPNLIKFQPLWFTHSLIESIDKLYLPRLASLRYNLSQNPLTFKLPVLILIEFISIALFLSGNMGIRLFSLPQIFSQKYKPMDKLLFTFSLIALIIPLLFVQTGTAWNTIQFFYYFLFIANFYTAIYLSKLNTSVIALLLIPGLLTSYSTLKDYFGNPPPTAVSFSQLETLEVLNSLPAGIVLNQPYDAFKKNELNTPIPIHYYETTAYIPALTKHHTFLSDTMNLDITGYDWQSRLNQVNDFFNSTDLYAARGFLVNNKIDYIYLVESGALPFSPYELQIQPLFNRPPFYIFRVLR